MSYFLLCSIMAVRNLYIQIDLDVNLMTGVTANRLAVKTGDSDDDDISKMSPRDVTDQVVASARRANRQFQPCSSQTVDTAWSLLATNGYRSVGRSSRFVAVEVVIFFIDWFYRIESRKVLIPIP